MIRFFEDGGWSKKVNWIDSDNVFVGFDFDSQCCEDFNYEYLDENGETITKFSDSELINQIESGNNNLLFDKDFYKESDEHVTDKGGSIKFKMIDLEKNLTIYLVLFNYHNGYYHHGFEFKHNEKIIKEGYL